MLISCDKKILAFTSWDIDLFFIALKDERINDFLSWYMGKLQRLYVYFIALLSSA